MGTQGRPGGLSFPPAAGPPRAVRGTVTSLTTPHKNVQTAVPRRRRTCHVGGVRAMRSLPGHDPAAANTHGRAQHAPPPLPVLPPRLRALPQEALKPGSEHGAAAHPPPSLPACFAVLPPYKQHVGTYAHVRGVRESAVFTFLWRVFPTCAIRLWAQGARRAWLCAGMWHEGPGHRAWEGRGRSAAKRKS